MENELKKIYMTGFNDELDNVKPPNWFKTEIEKKAYFTGRADAIIGDDVPSHDYRSWDDILKEIKSL